MNKNLPTMVIHFCELGKDQFPFLLGYLNLFFYRPVSANRCQVECHVGRHVGLHLSQTCCIPIILFPPGSSSFALWGRVTLAMSVVSPGLLGGYRSSHLISSIRLLLPVPSSGLSGTITLFSQLAGSSLTPSCSRFNSYLSSAALPEAEGLPSLPCKGCGCMCHGQARGKNSSQPSLPPS